MKAALIIALWTSWTVSWMGGVWAGGDSCVFEVSQGMMRGLIGAEQASEQCDEVWARLLVHVHYTCKNLTTCQERELASVDPEPTFADCQRRLRNAQLDLQDDQRYHVHGMQQQIQRHEWNVKKYQAEQQSLLAEFAKVNQQFKGYYRELLFVNVAAGGTKTALRYYHLYLEGQPPGQLLNDLVAAVYREPGRENERLENLLDFVRKLAGNSVKLALYELIMAEVDKRPEQRDSYLAVMATLDLGRIAFLSREGFETLKRFNPIFVAGLGHLQKKLVAGEYDEIIKFATGNPDLFEQIETRFVTLEPQVWSKLDFAQFVSYPNRLPLARQRLEAIRVILAQVIQYNKHDFRDRLVRLAKEVDQCEQFLKQGKSTQAEHTKLSGVKEQFAKLDPERGYEHYLKESQKHWIARRRSDDDDDDGPKPQVNQFIMEMKAPSQSSGGTNHPGIYHLHLAQQTGPRVNHAGTGTPGLVNTMPRLSQDIGYVLYSALGSFYIPSCIMVFVYIRIYFAAKARARRGIRKKPLKPPSEQDTSFTRNAGTVPMPSLPSASSNNNQSVQQTASQPLAATGTTQIATIEPPPRGIANPMPIPVVTCDFASDMSTSEAATAEQDNHGPLSPVGGVGGHEPKDTLKVTQPGPAVAGRTSGTNGLTTPDPVSPSPSAAAARSRALSVGIDTDMVSEFDPSSSDSGVISRCAVVKPLKFRLCQPIFGKGKAKARQSAKVAGGGGRGGSNNCTTPMLSGGGGSSGGGGGQQAITQLMAAAKQAESAGCSEVEPALPPKPKPRDPEKEKRRIARKKEKRATLILGLIMGSFIACWLPFFFLYILVPICPDCHIPDSAFSLAFWLGYMNSALNPAIYTIFNKDFRRAFRRILFK
uniref:G-protein coupled receptors family 1 profile domain-containing protein n=1 Tax=Anopheles farauti TaxID=69004 RepID=A0A182QJG7_9DIPT